MSGRGTPVLILSFSGWLPQRAKVMPWTRLLSPLGLSDPWYRVPVQLHSNFWVGGLEWSPNVSLSREGHSSLGLAAPEPGTRGQTVPIFNIQWGTVFLFLAAAGDAEEDGGVSDSIQTSKMRPLVVVCLVVLHI